jgi:hypothetical protein
MSGEMCLRSAQKMKLDSRFVNHGFRSYGVKSLRWLEEDVGTSSLPTKLLSDEPYLTYEATTTSGSGVELAERSKRELVRLLWKSNHSGDTSTL